MSSNESNTVSESQSQQQLYVMAGNNLYNENSTLQATSINSVLDLIIPAVRALELNDTNTNNPFIIVDYGSSTGGNSITVINQLITILRQFYPNQTKSIIIIHEDQPTNDWNCLFNTVHSNNNSNNSYIHHPNVFVLASGTGFYHQLMPNNSISFGYSSTAFHWLDKIPIKLTNHISSLFTNSTDSIIWSQYAAEQWYKILYNRSNELKLNSILLLVMSARTDTGYCGFELMLNSGNRILLELIKNSIITMEEYININLPQYNRTMTELLDPNILELTGFKCIESKLIQPKNPLYEQYINNIITINEYSKKSINQWRGWFNSILDIGLIGTNEQKLIKKELIYSAFESDCLLQPNEWTGMGARALLILKKIKLAKEPFKYPPIL